MNGRPLGWPTWPRLSAGISGALWVALAFFPIYLGAGAITGLRDGRLQLHLDWELAIPFWPAMIVPYLSMFVLFLIPPLQLDERELSELTRRLVIASIVGGLIFLCLPAEMGFAEHSGAGVWQPLYDAVYRIDNRFNMVPSFHVIYTASILFALTDVATVRMRHVYAIWLVLVCASTVLTHRHHLLDVAVGLAIAVAVRRVPVRVPWPGRAAPKSLMQGDPQ